MELRDYVRVLRVRWRIVSLLTLLGIGAALYATHASAKVYRSNAQVIVASPTAGSLPEAVTANQYIQNRITSYLQFISSPDIAESALRRLGSSKTPGSLSGRISAEGVPDTVLINVHVKAPVAAQAQRETDAVVAAFINRIAQIEPGAGGGAAVAISVVRPASLPSLPISPRPKTNLLVGLFAGAFLGVALALVRESLDTRVASPDAVDRLFSIPTLSVVAYEANAKDAPIVSGDRRSTRGEAYRRLRTNLQFVDVDNPLRSLVVTSSVPGEGKTTTACNLAVLLAEAGVDVTLVEGDLRRPRLDSSMGVEGAVGITDVLVGRAKLEDVLQPWGSTGRLNVLPAGPLPPNPSEILGTKHMVQLVRTLEETSLVIIDAPPLLPVTDAAILTAITGGALLVIRAKSTRREQLSNSVQSLRDVNGRILGAVFNMASTRGPDAYGYQYGYAYYGRQDAKRGRRRGRKKDQPDVVAAPPVTATASSLARVVEEPVAATAPTAAAVSSAHVTPDAAPSPLTSYAPPVEQPTTAYESFPSWEPQPTSDESSRPHDDV